MDHITLSLVPSIASELYKKAACTWNLLSPLEQRFKPGCLVYSSLSRYAVGKYFNRKTVWTRQHFVVGYWSKKPCCSCLDCKCQYEQWFHQSKVDDKISWKCQQYHRKKLCAHSKIEFIFTVLHDSLYLPHFKFWTNNDLQQAIAVPIFFPQVHGQALNCNHMTAALIENYQNKVTEC